MPILTPTSAFKRESGELQEVDALDLVVRSGFLSPSGKAPNASKDVKQGSYWQCNKTAVSYYQNGQYTECITAITEAKRLVDQNPNKTANAYNKSIVYYNYSQFVSAIYPFSVKAKQEALKYIDQAIATYQADNNYHQDCLVHKAYVLFSQKKIGDAQNVYKAAFELNPGRFIESLTTDGTGKELFFWAIDCDSFIDSTGVSWSWLDKLSELKGLKGSHITPNVSSNGLGALLVAVIDKKLEVVEKLLALGADPCYRDNKAISKSALAYALRHEEWALSKKFIEYMRLHPEFVITEEVRSLFLDIPEEIRIFIDSSGYAIASGCSSADSKITVGEDIAAAVESLSEVLENVQLEDQSTLAGVTFPSDVEV
jgi:tetratricopeptide (TPR) repeat protein